MENLTDNNLKELYRSFEDQIKSQQTITDAHARKMATMAARSMLDIFKIWFMSDLKRLGLDARLSWQIEQENKELLVSMN